MKYVIIVVLLGLSTYLIVKNVKAIIQTVKEKKSQNKQKGDSE